MKNVFTVLKKYNTWGKKERVLSKELKSIAWHYALSGITQEQVEDLSGIAWDDLPEAFHKEVQDAIDGYEEWCRKMEEGNV